MHIIYLVHDFPIYGLATGGAGNYVANIALIMRKHGHTVDVITEGKDIKDFIWEGIHVHIIDATKGFSNTGRRISVIEKIKKNILRSIRYNREVERINKENPVDIVQSVNTYGIALFRRKKIPYIIRLSSYPPLWGRANREYFNYEKSLKSHRLDEELQLIALRRADAVISPSKIIAEVTKKRIHREVKVVESPVYIVNYESERNPIDGKYFLTYGALNYRKSIQALSSVIPRLLKEYPKYKYVLIGRDREILYRGQYQMASEMLKSQLRDVEDRFIFCGEISNRIQLFKIIHDSDLCILPTRIDNLPNTILESMALGKIVISTSGPNPTSVEQLIENGVNGFLAKVDDVNDICNTVVHVMNLSNDEKEKIQLSAKKRVRNLNEDYHYKIMSQIYRENIN